LTPRCKVHFTHPISFHSFWLSAKSGRARRASVKYHLQFWSDHDAHQLDAMRRPQE
jgi:hypothetical protein